MPRHRRQRDLFWVSYDDFCVPADKVLFIEHDDMDDEQRAAKRRRIEDNARRYLTNGTFHIQSATLKGPFDAGWNNPWRTKGVAVQQPVPMEQPQLPKSRKATETTVVKKRNPPRRNTKEARKPQERTKRKMDEKKAQIKRAPKPTVQKEKQLELIRSDTPTRPPTPHGAVQNWLRRVPAGSLSPTGATFDKGNDIFYHANDTPSKTSAMIEKNLCGEHNASADVFHPAKSFHPATSRSASPVAIAFTPINQAFHKVMFDKQPVQGHHGHVRAAGEVLVQRTPSEGHGGDQITVEPGAEKYLNPHRFKQQSKGASENVLLHGNQRWRNRNHLYPNSSKPRFMTFESPFPGPARDRTKSEQNPRDVFSAAHPLQVHNSREGIPATEDAISTKSVGDVVVPSTNHGGQAVELRTVGAKNRQHTRTASLPIVAETKRRRSGTANSDSQTAIDRAIDISVLPSQAEKPHVDQPAPVVPEEPASLKVADSLPRALFILPAGPKPTGTLAELEDNNPPTVPSFPERQNSRAYSSFSGDMNTQTALFQAQREFVEEFCSPVKSPDHSPDKHKRASTPPAKSGYAIAPFRSFQSPGPNDGSYKGNMASTQDLMAAAEALAFSTVKKSKKGSAAKPGKKASFVSFTISKPFASSDENKDPEKTEESLPAIANTHHASAAEASHLSIAKLLNNPTNSPTHQPILKTRSSLKQLRSLSKSNSQPTSTTFPSLTSIPAASNSGALDSGTAMPTPYQMGQRMFSTGDGDAELDVDIDATLDDFSQFLNVDMTV